MTDNEKNVTFLSWQKYKLFVFMTFLNDESSLIVNGKCISGDRPRKLYNERALNLPLGAELITGNIWYSEKPGISYQISMNGFPNFKANFHYIWSIACSYMISDRHVDLRDHLYLCFCFIIFV